MDTELESPDEEFEFQYLGTKFLEIDTIESKEEEVAEIEKVSKKEL